jgi:hypothetical protein
VFDDDVAPLSIEAQFILSPVLDDDDAFPPDGIPISNLDE